MKEELLEIFTHSTMITGFVMVMMLLIEYFHVLTRGVLQKLPRKGWQQYALAGLLGVIPGCLGSFTAVALFSHRMLSVGALVTTMIATSGDEAFLMLAMIPEKSLWILPLLFVIGVFAGYLTDKVSGRQNHPLTDEQHSLQVHNDDQCICFDIRTILSGLSRPSRYRIVLVLALGLLIAGVSLGYLAHEEQIWIRNTIILTSSIALFVILTVPEHFLRHHLWEHILMVHFIKIFLWTTGVIAVLHLVLPHIDVAGWISGNVYIVLLIAVLVGIIPESGPHLIFLTLFVDGSLPLSIFIASSIAQDGHGMLPMLAESKKGFLLVKGINVGVALIVGLGMLAAGF